MTTTTTRKTSTTTSSTTVRRRKSVILQCAVTGETDVQVAWSKDGSSLSTSQEARESRFSVEKKASEVREHETIVQLEILDASVDDKGTYELVATSAETGDQQKQKVLLTEEQIKLSIADDETEPKKKKKKVVKKKKKVSKGKKEVKPPELSSFLKSLIKKEGENIEMQCRLEEEMEEGDVKVQWFINDTELVESDQISCTFDGTYAKLFIANCTMEHTGAYKCVFTNEAG